VSVFAIEEKEEYMIRKVWVLCCLLGLSWAATAAWFGAEFSADAVQYDPQGRQWKPVGKMYAGKDRMRLESLQGGQGQSQVMIVDAATHTMSLLNPQQRAYMEMKGMQAIPMLAVVPMPDEAGSPCQEGKMQCKKLGEESVNGVPAEKWEFVVQQEKAPVTSLQWFDRSRKLALRQEFPNNQVIERKYVGKAKLGDREVEKWEISVKQEGKTQEGVEYIDPTLSVVVRQEQQGGKVTALSDIKVGPQSADLFQIPAGYRKQEMGQGGAGGTAPGGSMPR
jgi:hypothetical protein